MRSLAVLLCCAALCATTSRQIASAADTGKRPLSLDDIARLREVGDPQVSLEGEWVAYTVRVADLKSDKATTSIRMVRWEDGKIL
jgi:hypothetical protein